MPTAWEKPAPTGAARCVLFVSPTCPVCKTLLPAVKSSRRDERDWMDVILATDGDLKEQQEFVRAQGLEAIPYVVSAALGLAFQVSRLPFAALLDEHGVLRARGLVNSTLGVLMDSIEHGAANVVGEAFDELIGRSKRSWALILVAFVLGAAATAVVVIKVAQRARR